MGCRLVTTTGARSSSPSSSTTPCTRPSLDDQPLDPGVGADLGAERLGRPARSRPTPRPCRPRGSPSCRAGPSPTSPMEWCAITYAVPGSYGPGPGADDAVDRHRALDLRRLEPVVEQVGDAHRHQPGHVGRWCARRGRGCSRPAGRVSARSPGRVATRWWAARVVSSGPEHVGEAGQPGVPPRPGLGVLLRPPRDLVVRARLGRPRRSSASRPRGRPGSRAPSGAPCSRAGSSCRSSMMVGGIRLIT